MVKTKSGNGENKTKQKPQDKKIKQCILKLAWNVLCNSGIPEVRERFKEHWRMDRNNKTNVSLSLGL